MTRVDDERERLQQRRRVCLMPPPMVVGFLPFYRAAQPRIVERLPLLEPSPNSSVVISVVMLPHNKTDWNLVPEKTYQVMKANVDALKIIQLGLTLSYEHGNLPDLGNNNKTQNSLHLAVQYPRLQPHLAAASGLLLNKALTWVTFHGAYDIGYLVKILTWGVLPTRLEEFLELVKELFGRTTYDVKHVMRFCNALYGGLEKVADTLHIDRVVRQCHQAGSDRPSC
ncbi:probable CCR4-associated factor 1 homolog 11 [Arachis duranensis]|uniref:Probable CCR4-associated factor 1 homolog 11 n=1 Tax=Arachis duranensis TaxID=130453 RepID=A0A9C6TRY5_ARADU|nr:probable CCR4-associated factor 1 homolog 11 [Arachis duranensis]